jgi:hypothetical protein
VAAPSLAPDDRSTAPSVLLGRASTPESLDEGLVDLWMGHRADLLVGHEHLGTESPSPGAENETTYQTARQRPDLVDAWNAPE